MKGFFSFLILFLFFADVRAQETGIDTVALKNMLTAFKNDSLMTELRAMFDSTGNRESFFSVTTSLSNRLFSASNNAFNSQQSNTGQTAFSPAVSYLHKSGWGMTATGYVRNINAKTSFYQLALTPSFDHIGTKHMYGVAYTRYIKDNALGSIVTPYNHELYAYYMGRSTWIRPQLALGWATGHYNDVSQVTYKLGGNTITVTDTSLITLRDLSLTAGFSHSFGFENVFAQDDLFTLVPQVSLIGGLQDYSTTTKSTIIPGAQRGGISDRQRIGKFYKISKVNQSSLSLQTAAFSLNANWYSKAFSISAGYFLGYYFNTSASTAFSHLFFLTTGITF